MRFGCFFDLDNNSNRTNGMVRFRYRRIRSVDGTYLPIYVSLGKDSIEFRATSVSGKENALFSLEKVDGRSYQEGLEVALNKVFSQKKGILFKADYKKNIKYEAVPFHVPDYSSLDCFSINGDNKRHIQEGEFCRICQKTIFLDFIWDINHSVVFRNSSNLKNVYSLIGENFLFKSIRAKAEFYYQKESVARELTSTNLYLSIESMRDWANQLKITGKYELFEKSPWLADLEIERKRIMDFIDELPPDLSESESTIVKETLLVLNKSENLDQDKQAPFDGHLYRLNQLSRKLEAMEERLSDKQAPFEGYLYKLNQLSQNLESMEKILTRLVQYSQGSRAQAKDNLFSVDDELIKVYTDTMDILIRKLHYLSTNEAIKAHGEEKFEMKIKIEELEKQIDTLKVKITRITPPQ